MSTENKDIPAEELKRMEDNAHNSVMVSSLLEMPFDLYMRGAKAEYLRHLSGKAVIEIEIRRSTIDRLYQSILASGHPFPPQIREIFHNAMNSLGSSEPAKEPQPGMSAKDFITWCADETKFLAQRDKDFFYMGAGRLFEVLAKMPSPQPEPSEESRPDDFLEWLDGNIEFCEPRAKGEEIQNGTSGSYWTGQINLLRQVRDKHLSLHAQPKGEVDEEKELDYTGLLYKLGDFIIRQVYPSFSADKIEMISEQYVDRFLRDSPSPPSVKPDKMRSLTDKEAEVLDKTLYRTAKKERSVKPEREDDGIIRAIREHTESLVAQGPEACRRFLKDAGILEEENPEPSPPSVQQEDGEVPEEIAKWIESIHDGRWGFRPGAIAMYHKMQEDKLSPKALDEPEDDLVEYHDIRVRNVLDSQEEEISSLRSQLSAKEKEINQLNEYRKEDKRYSEVLEEKITNLHKAISALRQEFDERLKLQIQLEAQLATIRQEKEDYRNMLLTIMNDVSEEDWSYRIRRLITKWRNALYPPQTPTK